MVVVVPKYARSAQTQRQAVLAVVTSIWKNAKRPKLSTVGLSMTHIVAARCLEFTHVEGSVNKWKVDDRSKPWIVRPEAVAAVLDCKRYDNRVENLIVEMTEDSEWYLDAICSLPDWWPVEELDEEIENNEPGLYLPRRRGRRAKAKAKASAKAKVKAGEESKKGVSKKIRKTRIQKAKPVPAQIALLAANLKKNRIGKALIEQTLVKMLTLEEKYFDTKPCFNADRECMIPGEHVRGVKWEEVLGGAFDYFHTEPLAFHILLLDIYGYVLKD